MADRGIETAQWLHPPAEEEGLRRYIGTIRERIWVVVAAVLVTMAVSVAYLLAADKTYQAQSELLVSTLANDRGPLGGLPLIFQSSDPRRDVETATQFVTNIDVANRVREQLDLEESPRELLVRVEAEAVGESNVIAVSAEGDTPEKARDLANAFAEGAVEDRTEQLHSAIDAQLPAIQDQLENTQGEAVQDRLGAHAAQLQRFRNAPDPSLRVETEADLPTEAAWPRPALIIAGGLFAGLVLGIAGAFASHALDPRLRREEQLRRLYALPILGRIPREGSRQAGGAPLAPGAVSTAAAESFRNLRGTLEWSGSNGRTGSRVILVTGASPSEGKSTTAANLASSLALAGNRVILIEADLRRPSLARAFRVSPDQGGVVSVLIEKLSLRDGLIPSPKDPNLQLLLADYEGGWIADLFSVPARTMIEEARQLADYVVIDSPPLNEVIDAMPLAREADDVLIVVRLGKTRLDKLSKLGELLAENGIRPSGFSVIGVPPAGSRRAQSYYRQPDERAGTPAGRPSARRGLKRPEERPTGAGSDWQRWGMGGLVALTGISLGMLAGVSPQISIVALMALAFAFIAFTDLAAGVALYVIASFVAIFPFTIYDGLARLVLALAWLALVLTKRRAELEFPSAHPVVSVALFLFVSWAYLSAAWAQDAGKAVEDATYYALSVLLFLIVFTAVRTRRDLIVIFSAFLVGAVVALIYGYLFPEGGRYAGRLESSVLDPNLLAAVLVSGLAIAVALIALDRRPLVRLMTVAAAGLCSIGIFLTTSRAAMIGLVVCLLATIALAGRWRVAVVLVSLVAAAGSYVYFVQFAPKDAQDRISQPFSGTQRSEDGRSTIWLLAWRAFQDEPVTGVGAGNFRVVQVRYLLQPGVERAVDQVIDDPQGKVAHSSFLSVLSELGLVGFVLFMFVIGFALVSALRAAKLFGANGDVRMQVVSNSIAIALLGLLALQNFHSDQQGVLLWLLLALGPALLAMARLEAEPVPATSAPSDPFPYARPSTPAPVPS